jgi:hypothetical protein
VWSGPKRGNKHQGTFLKYNINRKGYAIVKLYPVKTVSVHRLVAETFIPNSYNLPQVNHIDGNKLNNSVANLEWCSNEYNLSHANETGLISDDTRPRGIGHGRAKITEADVIEIRHRYKSGCKINGGAAIARDYGIHSSTVNDIVNLRLWTHL